ncbi:ABC transporter permease, partial [Bacteroides sp. OttesenSCG-928-E20]|nr:ABC transporter permease [Bacteroides sp. OttesenSCG-928-E20]
FDTFHPYWKNTYAITTTGLFKTADGKEAELNQLHEDAQNHFATYPEIERICCTNLMSYTSDGKDKSWIGMQADSTFFSMFHTEFIEGTNKGNAYNGESVVLTQKVANYLFADSLCTGKIFQVNKRTSFVIAGVIQNYPQNTEFKFDYIILEDSPKNNQSRSTVYVQVNPQADVKALRKKIETYRMDKEDTEYFKPSQHRFHLRTMPDVHLRCMADLSVRFRNINILAFAGLLAFVSALMNLLVLFVGQQQRKLQSNFTFRVMGASFGGLTGKKLIELLLPLLLSFALALAFIEIIFPYYQQYTQIENWGFYSGINQSLERDQIFVAAALVAGGSTIVFVLLSLFPIIVLLKQKKGHSVSRFFRNGLIAGQIFIGSLFFITSLGVYSQFTFMSRKDKGIVMENIWQINLGFNAAYSEDCRPFAEALRNNPYIEEVTGMVHPVLSPQGGSAYCTYLSKLKIEGRNMENSDFDYIVAVEPNFLSFFGLKMKEGEWMTNQSTYDYVVNETGARVLGEENIVGRRINVRSSEFNSITSSICGIVKDYHYCPMQFPVEKTFFVILKEDEETRLHMTQQYYYIKVSPANTEKALEFARTLYKEYEKGEINPANQITYLPDIMDEFNRQEKSMFSIFTVLALVCILISSFGIYSLVSLSAEQRRKEIAIRKVNGALFRNILELFLKEYLWLVLIGNALALSLGYLFMQRWLETYAYRTTISTWLYIGVLAITSGIVVVSVAVQVKKAARQNAAEAIKSN